MKPIEILCLEDRVAVRGQVAVTLVIGEEEEDIRAFAGDRSGGF
jgi:hypothetical protein